MEASGDRKPQATYAPSYRKLSDSQDSEGFVQEMHRHTCVSYSWFKAASTPVKEVEGLNRRSNAVTTNPSTALGHEGAAVNWRFQKTATGHTDDQLP